MSLSTSPSLPTRRRAPIRRAVLAILLAFLVPVAAHGVVWGLSDRPRSWREADWSSTNELPPAREMQDAAILVYAARTGGWKGAVAVHTWIVLKDAGGAPYRRYDVVGWGNPVRRDTHAPDARWYGNDPVLVAGLFGAGAAALIPRIDAAIAAYPMARRGDYRVWPGPNSNSFVKTVLDAVPEFDAQLPPTAIGKDYPVDGRAFRWSPDGRGFELSLQGLIGLSIGYRQGIELNLMGAVLGLDWRDPAIKLPGFGRVGPQ
jgi:hypothetical protein